MLSRQFPRKVIHPEKSSTAVTKVLTVKSLKRMSEEEEDISGLSGHRVSDQILRDTGVKIYQIY